MVIEISHGAMGNVIDYDILVSKFELHLYDFIHFQN